MYVCVCVLWQSYVLCSVFPLVQMAGLTTPRHGTSFVSWSQIWTVACVSDPSVDSHWAIWLDEFLHTPHLLLLKSASDPPQNSAACLAALVSLRACGRTQFLKPNLMSVWSITRKNRAERPREQLNTSSPLHFSTPHSFLSLKTGII